MGLGLGASLSTSNVRVISFTFKPNSFICSMTKVVFVSIKLSKSLGYPVTFECFDSHCMSKSTIIVDDCMRLRNLSIAPLKFNFPPNNLLDPTCVSSMVHVVIILSLPLAVLGEKTGVKVSITFV